MERLSVEVVEKRIREKDGWKLKDQKWLVKGYRFGSFMDGIAFVQSVAQLSEEKNHHPFFSIDYKLVTLRLTSWNAKGITELDLELIDLYDQLHASLDS